MNFFKKWLGKQRKKSEIEAKGIAFIFSFLITAVISLVWIFTIINTSFNNDNSGEQNMNSNYETAKPLDTLISNVKSVFNR